MKKEKILNQLKDGLDEKKDYLVVIQIGKEDKFESYHIKELEEDNKD